MSLTIWNYYFAFVKFKITILFMSIIVFYLNYCFAQRISKDLNLFDRIFGYFTSLTFFLDGVDLQLCLILFLS